ncbi:helix-turn-helix transcriptional regulator [Falsirhodobacter deserti]|uniref:helix-turn-helix transcriptional regulator n=1 Tax=Falsirhodobacter deserti TaxID=1365611 RepID=UPI000FE351C2|nr:helix-turn-helix transcriptional regulator [Falsirhodobacter deserti]
MFKNEIDHLYAALLGERPWTEFLQRLVRDVPGGKATLQMYDCQHPEHSFVASQTGFESAALAAYSAHYAGLNLLQQSLATKPAGRAFADDALVAEDRRTKDSFFNEWLMPNEVKASAGLKIQASGSRAVSLVLLSGQADAACRSEMTRALNSLAPHLQRASDFYKRRAQAAQLGVVDRNLLDQFGTGMLLLKSDGHVGFINDAARDLLEGQSTVLGFNNSRLHVRDKDLKDLVSRMMKVNEAGAKAVDYYAPGLKLSLLRPEQDSVEALFNGASLIILITGITCRPPRYDRRLIAQTYGLSAAEMRAVDGLMAGKSPADIAMEAGLSRETIRVQIRSLYAKTGAHSQADLIRLVRPR